MYIPKSHSEYHNHSLQYLSSLPTNADLAIIGDFYCPNINWQAMSGHSPFIYISIVFSALFDKNLIQLTTVAIHTQRNTMDLVLTNAIQGLSNIKVDSVNTTSSINHLPYISRYYCHKLSHGQNNATQFAKKPTVV